MSIRSRQIFFVILTLLFAVSAPLVILYAVGYRYNIKKQLIQKTGALVLDSKPDNARILINNEDAHRLTPARFPRIMPDDYRVRLEKEGYWSWEKTLTVLSGHTTFATDVLFFRQSLPEIISEENINAEISALLAKKEFSSSASFGDFTYVLRKEGLAQALIEIKKGGSELPKKIALLPLGNYVFIASPNNLLTLVEMHNARLYVIDPKLRDPIILEERATYGAWLPESKKLLLSDDFELHIYDLAKNEIQFVTRYGKPIRRALWIDEAHIILQFNESLVGMELDSRGERYAPILFSGRDIENLFLTPDAQTAYFFADNGGIKKLFKLPLQ